MTVVAYHVTHNDGEELGILSDLGQTVSLTDLFEVDIEVRMFATVHDASEWLQEQNEDEQDERAGPWKSGFGEYPMADEVYDLTHEREPDSGDPYDNIDDRDGDEEE